MSSTRYHSLNCDKCKTSLKQPEKWPYIHFPTWSAKEVRELARKSGWRFHSGIDVCAECRKVRKKRVGNNGNQRTKTAKPLSAFNWFRNSKVESETGRR